MSNYWLELSLQRRALAEMELTAKGYRDTIAHAAVERAWGAAWAKVQPVSETIRAQAFYDVLQDELRSTEAWCRQVAARAQGA